MRNRYILPILFMFVFNLWGCYEDKGNYEYEIADELIIKTPVMKSVSIGDEIKIEPELKLKSGSTDFSNYEFKWILNGESRPEWNKQNFQYKTEKKITTAALVLEATDKTRGVSFYGQTSVSVTGIYDLEAGYLILSEKNGESVLSLLKLSDTDYSEDWLHMTIGKGEVIEDVYRKSNGQAAGTGPVKIVEHYRVANNYVGSVLLVQKSGAIDLDGETMMKDLDYAEAFVDGTFPEPIVNAVFKKNTDVLVGESGRLYSRVKNDNKLFNSGKFLNEPMKFDNEILENCEPIYAPSSWNTGFNIIHDKKYERLLIIRDNNSVLLPFPTSTTLPEGCIQPNDLSSCEVFHLAHLRAPSIYFDDYYGMIIKKSGKYFYQRFKANAAGAIPSCSIDEILGLPGDPTCVEIVTYHAQQPYIFIAVGNKLYLYDTTNPDVPVSLYLEFDSEVVAMQADYYGGYMGILGLKNGKFYIFDTASAKNITDVSKRILYSSPEGLDIGEIKDVKRKIQSVS